MWHIEEYATDAGNVPVVEYLAAAGATEQRKASALILLVRERGNALREPHSKALGDGLYELRDVGTGVRIFYTMLPNKRIVLLDAMTKKRDDLPADVLQRLRGLKDTVKSRDAAARRVAQKPKIAGR